MRVKNRTNNRYANLRAAVKVPLATSLRLDLGGAHTHTHTHSLFLSHPHTHPPPHTHTHTRSFSLSHTHTYTHSFSLSLINTPFTSVEQLHSHTGLVVLIATYR